MRQRERGREGGGRDQCLRPNFSSPTSTFSHGFITAVSSEAWAKLRDWASVAGRGRLLLSGSVAHASLKTALQLDNCIFCSSLSGEREGGRLVNKVRKTEEVNGKKDPSSLLWPALLPARPPAKAARVKAYQVWLTYLASTLAHLFPSSLNLPYSVRSQSTCTDPLRASAALALCSSKQVGGF